MENVKAKQDSVGLPKWVRDREAWRLKKTGFSSTGNRSKGARL